MRCEDVRDELLLGGAPSAQLDAHARECAACGELQQAQRALNAALALDEPHRPGPGFDTRFFARLDAERTAHQKKRRLFSLRMWLWALVPAAAGVAVLVMRAREPVTPPEAHAPAILVDVAEEPDDLALLQDLELVEDLDVVQQLDALEDFDILADIEPAELDRIAAEEGTP